MDIEDVHIGEVLVGRTRSEDSSKDTLIGSRYGIVLEKDSSDNCVLLKLENPKHGEMWFHVHHLRPYKANKRTPTWPHNIKERKTNTRPTNYTIKELKKWRNTGTIYTARPTNKSLETIAGVGSSPQHALEKLVENLIRHIEYKGIDNQ